jgi:restriction endonuclease Mrr
MAIPTFQEVMLPMLQLMADGMPHAVKELVEQIEGVLTK